MQDLVINVEEIKEHSKRVESFNHNYLNELELFSDVMSSLIEHWDSPSANALYSEFQRFVPTFDKYYEYIETYKLFLDQTAQTYEDLDRTIENSIDIN